MEERKLLHQIRDELVEESHDLSNIFRKALILANNLNSDVLKLWVSNELSGYSNNDTDIPDYRILEALSYGDFMTSDQFIQNKPLPGHKIQDYSASVRISLGIRSLEHEISNSAGNHNAVLKINWPPQDFHAFHDAVRRINPDVQLSAAWKVVPINQIVQIVDSIKNRLLNFIMELESEADNSGGMIGNIPVENVERLISIHIGDNTRGDKAGGDKVGGNKVL